MAFTVTARTRIATAAAAKETADLARTIIEFAAEDFHPGDLVLAAKQLRLLALATMDRAVLAERAAGATWAEIAAAHSLDEPAVIARYGAVYDRWALADLDPGFAALIPGATAGDHLLPGGALESDPRGTAQSIDSWRGRHTDPWGAAEARPLEDLVG